MLYGESMVKDWSYERATDPAQIARRQSRGFPRSEPIHHGQVANEADRAAVS